jgi:DNA repair exonuclease SbcCD ATPase subunit
MLRRWLQENDFKYLDVHFGINQLTSRDSSSFRESTEQFEDRPVHSPEYRELKTSLKDLETTLGRQLVQLRKMEKQSRQVDLEANKLDARGRRLLARLDKTAQRLKAGLPEPRGSRNIKQEAVEFRRARTVLRSKQKNNADKREKILGHIAVIEQRIEPLQAQLCEATRKQSRLQLLLDGDYQLIDTRKKAMMDALRVTASNIFRNVQEQFRAIYDNYRDDHVLVRMLSRCSGTMTRTAQNTTFRLWLPGTIQPHRVRAIEELLRQVEQQTNETITSARPIRLELLSGPLDV